MKESKIKENETRSGRKRETMKRNDNEVVEKIVLKIKDQKEGRLMVHSLLIAPTNHNNFLIYRRLTLDPWQH